MKVYFAFMVFDWKIAWIYSFRMGLFTKVYLIEKFHPRHNPRKRKHMATQTL